MTSEQGSNSHPLGKLTLLREGNEAELAARARLSLADYLQVVVALVALTAAIHLFRVEEGLDLPRLMWIVTGGFLLYPLLPVRHRLPYFLALNIVALLVLFGVLPGLAAFGLGLLFIVCASLQIPHLYRVALVFLLGLGAALVKFGWFGGPASYQVATILGGLFMFRMILYLYEIRHEKTPVTLWKRISYFFLLPNLVFLIFPIVDYKTFVRNFYSRPAAETSRKGIYWIFTGFVHLLIYRLIYSYAIPAPDDIDGVYSLVQYIVFSYALIIRLSGIFHLSAGVICLFGFDLPRTFNHYFLASSFSDLWSRINVYWRGFVMKVFYYPIFMRFRNRDARAVFITVLIVFAINFFLHSYQWFWIRGKFYFSETDIVFWGVLGLMLAFNSVLALRRKPGPARPDFSWRGGLTLSLKVLGMFSFMCVMWSLWISQSLQMWWLLLRRGASADPTEYLVVFAGMAALVALGTLFQYIRARAAEETRASPRIIPVPVSLVTGVAAACCVLASPQVSEDLQDRFAVSLDPVFSEQLNQHDTELLRKGYYEELIIGNTLSSKMWEVREEEKLLEMRRQEREERAGDDEVAAMAQQERVDERPDRGVRLDATAIAREERLRKRMASQKAAGLHTERVKYKRKTRDLLMVRMLPNKTLIRSGARFSTNQFGLRDRQYDQEKPPGTYRIAQLGGSPQMGTGVADDETAENLVEDRLNSEGGWIGYDRVEILNFAMSTYALINQIGVASLRLDTFDPDMVLLYLHTVNEEKRNGEKYAEAMVKGLVGDYPYLEKLKRDLNIKPETPLPEATFKLQPFTADLFEWGLDWMARYCRERDVEFVVVIHDVLSDLDHARRANAARYAYLLEEKGIPYIDLSTYWQVINMGELTIARWDSHPKRARTRLIADKLLEGLARPPSVSAGGRARSLAGG